MSGTPSNSNTAEMPLYTPTRFVALPRMTTPPAPRRETSDPEALDWWRAVTLAAWRNEAPTTPQGDAILPAALDLARVARCGLNLCENERRSEDERRLLQYGGPPLGAIDGWRRRSQDTAPTAQDLDQVDALVVHWDYAFRIHPIVQAWRRSKRKPRLVCVGRASEATERYLTACIPTACVLRMVDPPVGAALSLQWEGVHGEARRVVGVVGDGWLANALVQDKQHYDIVCITAHEKRAAQLRALGHTVLHPEDCLNEALRACDTVVLVHHAGVEAMHARLRVQLSPWTHVIYCVENKNARLPWDDGSTRLVCSPCVARADHVATIKQLMFAGAAAPKPSPEPDTDRFCGLELSLLHVLFEPSVPMDKFHQIRAIPHSTS